MAGLKFRIAHFISHLNKKKNVCGTEEEAEQTLTENRENNHYFVEELGLNTLSHGFIGN